MTEIAFKLPILWEIYGNKGFGSGLVTKRAVKFDVKNSHVTNTSERVV